MAVTVAPERFRELVAEALDEVPVEFTDAMDNVVVLVEDVNPEDSSLLGLYHGIALTERDSHYGGALPDTITVYRLPITGICATEDEVVEQVTITVVHEIGHYFGMDEEELHRHGWG